jgi:hypothetical protein
VTAQTILLAAKIQPKEVAVSNRIQVHRQPELLLFLPTQQWEKMLDPVREKITELTAALIADWVEVQRGESIHEGGDDE